MDNNLRLWPALAILFLFAVSIIGVVYFTRTEWLILSVIGAVLLVSALIAISYVKSSRHAALLSRLYDSQVLKEGSIALKMLAELALTGSEKKTMAARASELIRDRFQVNKFVILFRENDRFVPRVYAGVNKSDLASPPAGRVNNALKPDLQNGVLTTDENVCRLAYRGDGRDWIESGLAFAFAWGRSRSVLVVADDSQGPLVDALRDAEFNRTFWPGLDYNLRVDARLREKSLESRQVSHELGQARRELLDLNKELKKKLLDLQSFVRISNDLYSLFNEEQLFSTLRSTICNQLGAGRAEILVPSGEGKYVIRPGVSKPEESPLTLTLDMDSELLGLLSKSQRPLLLPLLSSGLKQNEPFLSAAIRSGFQVASAIRVGGQTACILLVGEKDDKSQFTSLDQDFLYIIGNIASLALDNIQQYTTIERLSYTDSMTGIYNYRYFYKRLNEEVLRAKRYNRELSLVILDIDNFKSFNDNYGHQAGDLVLKQLSDMITRTIRSIDVVSRYGGEEFCIIMPDTGVNNCEVFTERLRSQIADFRFESELIKGGSAISVSVGGAVYPHHAVTPDRLIYCADMALLKAKSLGRNRVMMFLPDLVGEEDPAKGRFNESRQKSIQ